MTIQMFGQDIVADEVFPPNDVYYRVSPWTTAEGMTYRPTYEYIMFLYNVGTGRVKIIKSNSDIFYTELVEGSVRLSDDIYPIAYTPEIIPLIDPVGDRSLVTNFMASGGVSAVETVPLPSDWRDRPTALDPLTTEMASDTVVTYDGPAPPSFFDNLRTMLRDYTASIGVAAPGPTQVFYWDRNRTSGATGQSVAVAFLWQKGFLGGNIITVEADTVGDLVDAVNAVLTTSCYPIEMTPELIGKVPWHVYPDRIALHDVVGGAPATLMAHGKLLGNDNVPDAFFTDPQYQQQEGMFQTWAPERKDVHYHIPESAGLSVPPWIVLVYHKGVLGPTVEALGAATIDDLFATVLPGLLTESSYPVAINAEVVNLIVPSDVQEIARDIWDNQMGHVQEYSLPPGWNEGVSPPATWTGPTPVDVLGPAEEIQNMILRDTMPTIGIPDSHFLTVGPMPVAPAVFTEESSQPIMATSYKKF